MRPTLHSFLLAATLTLAAGQSATAHDDPVHRVDDLSRAIAREPGNHALRLKRAGVYRQIGRWSKALADCDAVIAGDASLAAPARLLRGRVLLASGEAGAALACADRLLAADPSDARSHLLRARSLVALERGRDAVRSYDKAFRDLEHVGPDLHVERARALADLGAAADMAEAVVGLDDGLARCGPVITLEETAIDLDVRRGAYDDALERLARIEQHVRRPERWRSRRGDVLAMAGRCGEARHAYESALEALDDLPPRVRHRPATATLERHVTRSLAGLGNSEMADLAHHEHHGTCGNTPMAVLKTLVPAGAEWKYLDDGSDQETAWREPDFDDGAWAAGAAQLGYGDGDEVTEVGYGDDPVDRHVTTYFRREFTVDDPSKYDGVLLRLMRDDGAVAYVNGVEIHRTNMPGGSIDFATVASSIVGNADETWFTRRLLSPDVLVPGANTLAVELHQESSTSADLSFDAELIATDGPAFVTRGPYLQMLTETSVVVRWEVDPPVDGVVSYGTDPESMMSEVIATKVAGAHEVTIEGLEPATTYSYAIGTTSIDLVGGDGYRFTTAPPVGSCVPVRIWAIGDSGTAKPGAANVRDAYAAFSGGRHTDVWLMLGDNAYDDGTQSNYQSAVFDWFPELLRSTAVWPTIGNHDVVSADSPTESGVYYDVLTLPQRGEAGGLASGTEAYYSFDYANIHFICLDSHDTDRSPGGPMMTWLAADVADTLADWIIAYWHHPPYTRGTHDSDDSTDSGGRLRDMREVAVPILEQGGVDLVLCGHSHVYERSFLIDGHYGASGSLTPDMIMDGGDGRTDGDGAYRKPPNGGAHFGAVYGVLGSSGLLGEGPLDHPAMFIGLEQRGSLVIDVEGLQLDATFLNEFGVVSDHFTILKDFAPGDVDLDGLVSVPDLLQVLTQWGDCPPPHAPCAADFNGNGVVGINDLMAVLVNWTP